VRNQSGRMREKNFKEEGKGLSRGGKNGRSKETRGKWVYAEVLKKLNSIRRGKKNDGGGGRNLRESI